VAVTWIVVMFLNGKLMEVPFVIRIETEWAKNKIVRPKGVERYFTQKQNSLPECSSSQMRQMELVNKSDKCQNIHILALNLHLLIS
jgi:hypothetical protein